VTTIAASLDHRMIAADSRCSTDEWMFNVSKLRSGPESAFGAAGNWDEILKFYAALEKNGEIEGECDVTVLELRSDALYVYLGSLNPFPIKQRFWAVGTGAAYAIAAMRLGKDPVEAITLAMEFDPGTGGPIDTMRIPNVTQSKSNRRRTNQPV
jgi:hypothetical protein